MSLFEITKVPCPKCATVAEIPIYFSINGDRRPDLTEALIAGMLQNHTCTDCGTDFKADPSLNYLSVGEGLWLMARPLPEMAHWDSEEADAATSFDEAYGSGAPADAKEIGDLMTVRLTFGWPAFREKVLAAQHGLNDVGLEMTKMAILRNRPNNPVQPGVELRLTNVRGDAFDFAWINAATNEALDQFEARRALYEDINGNAAWADMEKQLTAGCFVDLARLTIVPEPRAQDA